MASTVALSTSISERFPGDVADGRKLEAAGRAGRDESRPQRHVERAPEDTAIQGDRGRRTPLMDAGGEEALQFLRAQSGQRLVGDLAQVPPEGADGAPVAGDGAAGRPGLARKPALEVLCYGRAGQGGIARALDDVGENRPRRGLGERSGAGEFLGPFAFEGEGERGAKRAPAKPFGLPRGFGSRVMLRAGYVLRVPSSGKRPSSGALRTRFP